MSGIPAHVEVSADRVPGPEHPLWPSDHAGLMADLFVLPARGHVAALPP
ncbi:MAG: hypothetical protein ACREMF_05370 [Gemmatimonadales bacterium]